MKPIFHKLITITILSSFAFTPLIRLQATEKDDAAIAAEVERRVNEELAKRQKSNGPSATITSIYKLYLDNFIGQSKNLGEAETTSVGTDLATGGGAVGTLIGGAVYATGKISKDKPLKRTGKVIALASLPFAIWGIHRRINDAALLGVHDKLTKAPVSQEFYKKLSATLDQKKWKELRRDITAGWNLDKLFKKYADEEQAIIFASFYGKAKIEAEDFLKDVPMIMMSASKDSLIAEIASERAVRRYLSLEAEPEIQKDIQKWLDLNAGSIKDLARMLTAGPDQATAHDSKPEVQPGLEPELHYK